MNDKIFLFSQFWLNRIYKININHVCRRFHKIENEEIITNNRLFLIY